MEPLLKERKAAESERQKKIDNAGVANTRLNGCVVTNIAVLLGIYLFISSHHGGSSTYFHIGPRKDLEVMNMRIDTWLAYTKIVLFITVIQVIDVIVSVISDPIISWYLLNPVDCLVYGFTRWGLIRSSNLMIITSGAKSILTVYLSITQVDIALWRGLASAATMFFVTVYLTKNKTFIPNPPKSPPSAAIDPPQLQLREHTTPDDGKDKQEDPYEEYDMIPGDLSTMQPVLDITVIRGGSRVPSLVTRLSEAMLALRNRLWSSRGGLQDVVLSSQRGQGVSDVPKKKMPGKSKRVFKHMKAHQPGLVQGLLLEESDEGIEMDTRAVWSGIQEEGAEDNSYEQEVL